METWKYRILSNWDLMRIIRLAMGIFVLVQAINTQNWGFGLLAGLILFQAISGTGCCASGACSIDSRPSTSPKKEIKEAPVQENEAA